MSKILVIDDDPGVRESFSAALAQDGYAVTVAVDGAHGLESAKEQQFDLVFLDLKMPGMSGVETLKALHAQQPSVPVYVVTAFYDEHLAGLRELQSQGVDYNLARKPLTVKEIQMIAASRVNQTTSDSARRAARYLNGARVVPS